MTMHTLDAAHVTTHCAASRQRRKVSIENHIQTWNETSRQASVDELNYLDKSRPSRPRRDVFFHHWKTSLPTILSCSAEILVYIPNCCIFCSPLLPTLMAFSDVFPPEKITLQTLRCCFLARGRFSYGAQWRFSMSVGALVEGKNGQEKKPWKDTWLKTNQKNTIHLFHFIYMYLYI